MSAPLPGYVLTTFRLFKERLAVCARHLLSLVEIMLILQLLKDTGAAYVIDTGRILQGASGLEDADVEVNWESASWFPAGRWYR